jgi:hypothetical protein
MSTDAFTDEIDDLAAATGWVEQLESRFKLKGLSKPQAWQKIAEADRRRLTLGVIEGISRRRVKDVSTRVFRALNDLVVSELSNEIKGLERDLEEARRAALRVDPRTISTAEVALRDARQALKQSLN